MLPFLPACLFERLTDLSPQFLHERGIRLLLLDFDNTMLPYTSDKPSQALLAWLAKMRAEGIALCIVSNSSKPRVRRFSERYGIECVTRAKKPFGRGIREALGRFGIPAAQTALVGDQIFTDVLGANCAKLTAIHVRSICNHTVWLKLRHLFEIPFLALAKKRRITQ